MKAYCVSVMTICTLGLAITLIFMGDSIMTINDPGGSLTGTAYKKYSNFEYFKQEEQKEIQKNTDAKLGTVGAKTPEINWQEKWIHHKDLSIAAKTHEAKYSLYHSELITFLIFGVFLGVHFFLYRKFIVEACKG